MNLQRIKAGAVDVQLFPIWCDGLKEHPYAWIKRKIFLNFLRATNHSSYHTLTSAGKSSVGIPVLHR